MNYSSNNQPPQTPNAYSAGERRGEISTPASDVERHRAYIEKLTQSPEATPTIYGQPPQHESIRTLVAHASLEDAKDPIDAEAQLVHTIEVAGEYVASMRRAAISQVEPDRAAVGDDYAFAA